MPSTYPVVLTFTQEDRPLQGATVKIFPQDPTLQQWEAGGLTDEKGEAVLFTLGRYRGAVAGKYKIIVLKTDQDPSTFTGERTEAREEEYQRAESQRKTYDTVDLNYSDPGKTDLEVDVVPGGVRQSFELGKAVRILQKR